MSSASQPDKPRLPNPVPAERECHVPREVGSGDSQPTLPRDAELSSWPSLKDVSYLHDHDSANGIAAQHGQHDVMDDDEDPHSEVNREGDLGDLEGLTTQLFTVWRDGSETRWAGYMWSILGDAGLTTYEDSDEASRTLVVCRLIALAGISREFAARAWSEGHPGEWQESVAVAGLLGEYPRLGEVAVGRLAERTGILAGSDPSGGNRESAASLLCGIADDEWPTVVKALTDNLGPSWMFASLWMTRDRDARYPLPDEVIGSIVNSPTSEMMDAFAWVSDGCIWRS